jgi:hypothetical protein
MKKLDVVNKVNLRTSNTPPFRDPLEDFEPFSLRAFCALDVLNQRYLRHREYSNSSCLDGAVWSATRRSTAPDGMDREHTHSTRARQYLVHFNTHVKIGALQFSSTPSNML